MRSVRYRVGGPPDEHCAIHVVETAADLTRWAYWVAERSGQVLGLDCETNALDPHEHAFRTRTVQTADQYETWVVPVWEGPTGAGGWIGETVRRHPRWIAHFAENDERFLCRGMGLEHDPVRWDEVEPHFWDSQTVLAVYDPRTVTTHNKKDRIHPAIPRPRALKPTVTRLLTPALAAAEDALNARFRELAPKGYRGGGPKTRAWGFANVPIDDPAFLLYAALDPLCTVRAYHLMRRDLQARGQWPRTEAALAEQWMVDCATRRGMRVDEGYARWLRGELERVCAQQRPVLDPYEIGRSGMGGNVAKAFHSLGVTSPTKGDADESESWDKDALELTLRLCDEWIEGHPREHHESPAEEDQRARVYRVRELADAVAVTRKADKYRSTWVEPMIWTCEHADGVMHPSMRAVGTVTTRMSCGATATAGPLHSAPKREETRLRACVRAERGWAYVSADLRQGEPFTMAALSGDPDYLRDLTAGDINAAWAARLYPGEFVSAEGKKPGTRSFELRQGVKFAYLAACYGAADRKVDALLGLPGSGVLDQWRSQYPVFWAFSDRLNWETEIRLDSGHRVPLWDRFWVDERGELRLRTDEHGSPRPSRLGLNAATQGTQADILAVAMHRLRCWGWTWACRFFLHDEIVGCVPAPMADHFAAVLEQAMTVTYRGVEIGAEAEVHGQTWMPQTGGFSRDEVTVIDEEAA